MNETRLFLRFRDRRDGGALADLFDATAPELLKVAVHLVRDVNEADDLVQSTFRVAIERAESFDPRLAGDRGVRGWLFGILAREAARTRRRMARGPRTGLGAPGDDDTAGPGPEPAAGDASPLDGMIAAETPEVLARGVARLRPPYREVVEQSLFVGRAPAEIARALNRAPGTVRVQLQRGLERLRACLPREYAALGAVVPAGTLERHLGSGLEALKRSVLRDAGVSATVTQGAVAGKTVVLAGLVVTAALIGGTALMAPDSGHASEALASPELDLSAPVAPSSPAAAESPESARSSPPGLAAAGRDERAGPGRRPQAFAGEPEPDPEAEEPDGREPGTVLVRILPGLPAPGEGPDVILRRSRLGRSVLRETMLGGTARFDGVAPGRYEVVSLGGDGANLEPVRIDLPAGGYLEVELRPGGGSVQGRILGPDLRVEGFSAAGLGGFKLPKQVTVPREQWLAGATLHASGPMEVRGSIDPAEGTYELAGLTKGKYELRLFVQGLSIPFTFDTRKVDRRGLDLEPFAGVLGGRVRDQAGGEVRVRPIQESGAPAGDFWTRTVEVGPHGEFSLSQLPLGRHSVDWFPLGASVPAAHGTASVGPDEPVVIELTPHELVPVEGLVVLPSGGPFEVSTALRLYALGESGEGEFGHPVAMLPLNGGVFEGSVPAGSFVPAVYGNPPLLGQPFSVPESGLAGLRVEINPTWVSYEIALDWRGSGRPARMYWELLTDSGLRVPHWFYVADDLESSVPRASQEVFLLQVGSYRLQPDFGAERPPPLAFEVGGLTQEECVVRYLWPHADER